MLAVEISVLGILVSRIQEGIGILFIIDRYDIWFYETGGTLAAVVPVMGIFVVSQCEVWGGVVSSGT